MTESKLRELTQKLERQEDITIEEADEIYSVMNDLSTSILKIVSQKFLEDRELQELLNKDFPASALKEWYDVVAYNIEKGQSGNFILSIPYIYTSSKFCYYFNSAVEALEEYGSFEDRITSIWVNQKTYILFPKHFQSLFQREESGQLYVLHDSRAGFCRYPYKLKDGNTYIISQLLKQLSLIPVINSQDKNSTFSNADIIKYVLIYLKQKIPYVQMNAKKNCCGETVVFTNKEGIAIAKGTLKVTFEELLENAVEKNIIDETLAKEMLKHDKKLDRFLEGKFTRANLKYIDDVVKKKAGMGSYEKIYRKRKRVVRRN